MLNNRRHATSGAFTALRVSEWSVRRKIVGVLAIPVVLAAVFGGLRVSSELTAASDYSTNQQRATVLGPAIQYLTATERLALPTSLSDALGDGHTSAGDAYTSAESTLKRAAARAGLTPGQSQTVTAIIQIGDTLRSGSGTGITATTPVQLSDMTRLTNELVSSTLNTRGTPDPRVEALTQALNARLSLVKQQLLIQSSRQQTSLLDSVWLAAEIGVEGSALSNVKSVQGGKRLSGLIAANGTRLGEATTEKVGALAATPTLFKKYDLVNDRLLAKIGEQLDRSASSSKSRALTDSGIILLAILASLLLAVFVARALLNPLRKVRAGALEVANVKLPETVRRIREGKEPEEFTPIPVHSHEELGQLARAVDDMHRQAVSLATGEAQLRSQVGAMFVTLSRRNTTLVNQQLALIESLEQDEEDPQRLEQLFSLDHLATRMRRTAESLVILGGTSGRTAGFEELSVSDVIHAAVSEVQDYQRVRIDAAPDRMIVGRAASDLVHLMAELIDNALSYSPPGSAVTIQAAEEDGRVEIEILDNGLGMAGDALARANESLKRGGEVTIDTARRMGLFVVSRLAEEHGLKVKLRRNVNGGGIIASVLLPADVLVSDEPVQHVSILDASEEVEEPVPPVVEEEPEEEYDPYLERIEEAIAAVTGLPRRRPGSGARPDPAPAPAAAVSMFEPGPSPELAAAFEPKPLPSHEESDTAPESEERGPIALPTAQHEDPSYADAPAEDGEQETLAQVVTPDFGAERRAAEDAETRDEPVAETADETYDELVAETFDEPVDEPVAEPVAAWAEDRDTDWTFGWRSQEPVDTTVEVEPVAEAAVDDEWVVAEATPDDETVAQADASDEEAVVPHFAWRSAETVAEADPVREPESSEAVEPVESVEPFEPVEPVEEPAAAYAWNHEQLEPVEETPVVASGEVPEEVTTESPVRLTIRRPLSATPAAAALEGEFVAEENEPEDSTIFGQLRSNWLNDDGGRPWANNEIDRGWSAAQQAESAATEDTTRAGLPVRRPGGRLVPGSVTPEPTAVVRDPEAIRNRLAAHAAGVSRGRAAAAAHHISDDYAHEETGPA